METLVATILIVVIFLMSSMLMNSMFANTKGKNDKLVKQELLLLQYKVEHGTLQLPYYDELDSWEIEVYSKGNRVTFSAVHPEQESGIHFERKYE